MRTRCLLEREPSLVQRRADPVALEVDRHKDHVVGNRNPEIGEPPFLPDLGGRMVVRLGPPPKTDTRGSYDPRRAIEVVLTAPAQQLPCLAAQPRREVGCQRHHAGLGAPRPQRGVAVAPPGEVAQRWPEPVRGHARRGWLSGCTPTR